VTPAYDALLLAGFGGPEGPDDVMPFLENVTRGRGIPRPRLEAVAHHYLALGGVSPINAQNRALVAALGADLAARGIDLPVSWGNRNWDPFFADELPRLHADGHRRVLAIATSARFPASQALPQPRGGSGVQCPAVHASQRLTRALRTTDSRLQRTDEPPTGAQPRPTAHSSHHAARRRDCGNPPDPTAQRPARRQPAHQAPAPGSPTSCAAPRA